MSNLNKELPNGWVETTLGEVIDRITKGTTPKSFECDENSVAYIKSDALSYGGFLNVEKFVKISGKIHAKLKRSQLKEYDILLSMAGAFLGKAGLVVKDYLPANTNQAVAIIRVNQEKIFHLFLWYKLRNKQTVSYFNSIPSQSAQPNINFQEIKSLPINLPPLPEQKAIANVLTAFDNKIENLQAQNKTLEAMAQTIFKEWFGKYQVGDALPEGWRVGKLGDVAKLKSGYAFKSKNFIDESNYKALKIKDLKGKGNVSIVDISSLTKESIKIDRVQYFRLIEGDIVLAMSGNTTGKIGVVPPHENELYLNQRVGKFFLNDENQRSFLYNFLMSGNFEDKILSMGYGSAQPNISPSQIEEIDIIFPKEEKQQKYLTLSKPIYSKVLKNNSQIQTLKKTRDTLLPKLMRGELRVSEFKDS